MDKREVDFVGTVSSGTMRPDDLIPEFLYVLELHWPEKAQELVEEYDGSEDDDDYWLLDALFDALNEVAPEGFYFGASTGDGADYGFWLDEAIADCLVEYQARQNREAHPDGHFDRGGRWYPSEAERQVCCSSIRPPSRKWPYSLLKHCRSLCHVANLYGLEPDMVKRVYQFCKRMDCLPY